MTVAAAASLCAVPRRAGDPDAMRRVVQEKARHLLMGSAAERQRVEFQRAVWDAGAAGASALEIANSLRAGLVELGWTAEELRRTGISHDSVLRIVEGSRP